MIDVLSIMSNVRIATDAASVSMEESMPHNCTINTCHKVWIPFINLHHEIQEANTLIPHPG